MFIFIIPNKGRERESERVGCWLFGFCCHFCCFPAHGKAEQAMRLKLRVLRACLNSDNFSVIEMEKI